MSERHTPTEQRAATRYMIEMAVAAVLFLGLYLIAPAVLRPVDGSPTSIGLAVASLAPVLWMGLSVTRFVRGLDEFQRPIAYQAFSAGFAVAMVVAIALAVLGGAGLSVPMPEMWVFIGGMLTWGIALPILLNRGEK